MFTYVYMCVRERNRQIHTERINKSDKVQIFNVCRIWSWICSNSPYYFSGSNILYMQFFSYLIEV